MADIQNQTLARTPTGQISRLTLIFDRDNWNLVAKRIFGHKEVERRFFPIRGESDEISWFECGPTLADSIVEEIDKFISRANVNIKQLKELDIEVIRQDGRHNVVILSKPSAIPKISIWTRMIAKAKSIFKKA